MLKSLTRPVLAVLAVVLAISIGAQAAFADQRDFVLVNGSSITITHAYVSPSATDDWEEDVLGEDVLPSGAEITIRFSSADGFADQCSYDIKVLGENGEEGIMWGVDLCSVSTVTFTD